MLFRRRFLPWPMLFAAVKSFISLRQEVGVLPFFGSPPSQQTKNR
jgi:hypothetical protein